MLLAPSSPLEAHDLRSLERYLDMRRKYAAQIERKRDVELSLIRRDEPSFGVDGWCYVCGRPSTFVTTFLYACQKTPEGEDIPNWREHMGCPTCRLPNRVRASMHVFYELLRPNADDSIYLTEQATGLYRTLAARHPNLTGSEFLDDACPLGEAANDLRNEDLTRLTFADNAFDFVLSFDVMEHVSDDVLAMGEVFRCLKPGGRFLFTAPFACDRKDKVVRARLLPSGEIDHLLPPEFHGNPVSADGALCFRYFGWDALDDLASVGFDNCRAIHYWSLEYGYLGDHQFLFIADKPATYR